MNDDHSEHLSLLADYAEVARQYGWDPRFIDQDDYPTLLIGRTDKQVMVGINGKPGGAMRFVPSPYTDADGYPMLKITGTTEITNTETVNRWLINA